MRSTLLVDSSRGDPEDARGRGQRLHSKKASHKRPRASARPQLPTLSFAALTCFELLVLLGLTVFVIIQLRPGLLFNPNMDVGGDNGAHVAAVYYLAHTLLPEGQISGWDPQWFGGFPLYVFYFPLPAILVAILDHVFSFAVAFKLISVLGTVTLPASAYLFGRLAGFRRPTPILMAAAMLPFLFNWSYTIYGGNIASTLAGEYSFSLACSTGLCFLGCFVYGLRTGKLRWLAAILLAITILCHVVPALFFAGVAILFTLFMFTAAQEAVLRSLVRVALRILIPVGVVGCLIAAFWLLRFGVDLRYSSSMNYGRVTDYFSNLLPKGGEIAIQFLALVGTTIGIIRRDRLAITLGVSCIGAAGCFMVLPAGIAWNPRWLPFWFLFTALTAGYAVSELGTYIFSLLHQPWLSGWVTAGVGSALSVCIVAAYAGVLPFFTTPPSMLTPVRSWVAWNYSGYQARAGWPEFSQIVTMLDKAGAKYGCGRLDYEYTPNISDMGSNIVEMSIPLWTGGCMDSMEGIYFESSTSTPFHFLDQAQLSIQPSNPSPGLPYQSLNVIKGVAHLQLEGVNYFLANSRKVEAEADVDPMLVRIASTPENPTEEDGAGTTPTANPSGATSWVLYRILKSQVVTPLSYQPVVESGLSKTSWLSLGIEWYQAPADWAVPIAESGPASWRRGQPGQIVEPSDGTKLRAVHVSDIKMTDSSVTFHVSRVGVPVLVKIPYFPNWHSAGAAAPVEVTPNDMVVVPTSTTVTLTYGTTAVDWAGRAATLMGLAALAGMWRPANLDLSNPEASTDQSGGGTSGPDGAPTGDPNGAAIAEDPDADDWNGGDYPDGSNSDGDREMQPTST